MPTIIITDLTNRALADCATLPWQQKGERQPDGTWIVPVDAEVRERLDELRQTPAETDDDLIGRLIACQRGLN